MPSNSDGSISIILATYGEDKWKSLAETHAYPSVKDQKAKEIIIYHDPNGTAASCKNDAIAQATGEWIVICDADDQLDPGYCEEMSRSRGDLRYPSVKYIPGEKYAIVIPRRHLLLGNFMVIGTMFRKEQFLKVGGFSEHETWEDWFLFMQLTYIGCVPVLCHKAIYKAFRHPNSRVSVPDPTKTFLKMREEFAMWAMNYNGGTTNDFEYRKFLSRALLHGGRI
jgi:glycosyltransferase involved in cell wall biosynthesis